MRKQRSVGCGATQRLPWLRVAGVVLSAVSFCPAISGQERDDERTFLYDKILGMLAGSAIGDAMGAPTEMWSRDQIQAEYGFVRELHPALIEPSPEGIWELNPRAGTTTDDTRWKALAVDYLTGSGERVQPRDPNLKAADMARELSSRFAREADDLRTLSMEDPAPELIQGVMRLQWLQEWERVARAYLDGDIDGYSRALNRFYGGEMACAGLLFSPALGAYYPGQPEEAYRQVFAVDIYDLGYAKDVSAVTAAMVAAAIPRDSTPESILAVMADVDPHGYFESRLIGRQAFQLLRDARRLVHQARFDGLTADAIPRPDPTEPKLSANPGSQNPGALERARLARAYALLDQMTQRFPFHAGEIHLVNLTALLYSDFDFRGALEFVVNYGRDNDTTAAVTGAILGAHLGAARLPGDWVEQTVSMNRALGMDLEAMARRMVEAIAARSR